MATSKILRKFINYNDPLAYEGTTTSSTFRPVQDAIFYVYQNGPELDIDHTFMLTDPSGNLVVDGYISMAPSTIFVPSGFSLTVKGNSSYGTIVRGYGVK